MQKCCLRTSSAFGSLPGWAVLRLVVRGGDGDDDASDATGATKRLELLYVSYTSLGDTATISYTYNWDIRPILPKTCFVRPGPIRSVRKAELRLDTPDDYEGYCGTLFAIVLGSLKTRDLTRRIRLDRSRKVVAPLAIDVTLSEVEKALQAE